MIKNKFKNIFLWYLIPLLYPIIILLRVNSDSTKYISPLYAQAFMFSSIRHVEVFIVFLSVLILILNLYFFKKILDKLKIDKMQKTLTVILLSLTPAFITSFFYLNLAALSCLFFLMTIYLQDKPISKLTSFLSVVIWPISSILVVFYANYTKRKPQLISAFFGLLTIALVIHKFPSISFFSSHTFSRFIAEFGNLQGYSLPILLISLVGFAINWFNHRKHFKIYLFFIVVFLVSTYFKSLIFPVSFLISFWAARSIRFLYEKKWSLPNLKDMSLFIFFCLILLSTSFFVNNLSGTSPSIYEKEALNWMEENNHNGVVLSDSKNAEAIKYFSGNKPFVSISMFSNSNSIIAEKIFHSRDLVEVADLLDANDISYIYIDEAMKTGSIWTDRSQGLLFLLRNSDKFKSIYNSREIEIWIY